MTIDLAGFKQKTAAYTSAWNSGDPAAVADHFAPDGKICINRGDVQAGREALLAMAGGFMAAFPDLKLTCDFIRLAGNHAVFGWTLQGHHAETRNSVKVGGWEEWDLDNDYRIRSSLGWFDADDYQKQADGQPA